MYSMVRFCTSDPKSHAMEQFTVPEIVLKKDAFLTNFRTNLSDINILLVSFTLALHIQLGNTENLAVKLKRK